MRLGATLPQRIPAGDDPLPLHPGLLLNGGRQSGGGFSDRSSS